MINRFAEEVFDFLLLRCMQELFIDGGQNLDWYIRKIIRLEVEVKLQVVLVKSLVSIEHRSNSGDVFVVWRMAAREAYWKDFSIQPAIEFVRNGLQALGACSATKDIFLPDFESR